MATKETSTFSHLLLDWYDQHGRHNLPWQQTKDPYGIWISEIMLQQTQVSSVIPYYQRFMARFPDTQTLAKASLDEVLSLWSGLGYYARGRYLHKSARIICREYGNRFPDNRNELIALPGIGKSTAHAILAFAFDQCLPILDGNVKRVLCRVHAIEGWPGIKSVENKLWELAENYTPSERIGDYTQAIMDLGSSICARKPQCQECPIQGMCLAFKMGAQTTYPSAKPKKDRPIKSTTMVLIKDAHDQVLLYQRPPVGIWGGLWAFPECSNKDINSWAKSELGLNIRTKSAWPELRHQFSHFELRIKPVPAQLMGRNNGVMEGEGWVWYKLRQPSERGLATPIKKLLEQLAGESL